MYFANALRACEALHGCVAPYTCALCMALCIQPLSMCAKVIFS